MDVNSMMNIVLGISNPVICESALPDFSFSPENRTQGVRRAAFDELNGMFECDVSSRSK